MNNSWIFLLNLICTWVRLLCTKVQYTICNSFFMFRDFRIRISSPSSSSFFIRLSTNMSFIWNYSDILDIFWLWCKYVHPALGSTTKNLPKINWGLSVPFPSSSLDYVCATFDWTAKFGLSHRSIVIVHALKRRDLSVHQI